MTITFIQRALILFKGLLLVPLHSYVCTYPRKSPKPITDFDTIRYARHGMDVKQYWFNLSWFSL